MAQRPKITAGDEDQRLVERDHQIQHCVALVERNHDAADAFDQQDTVVSRACRAAKIDDCLKVNRSSLGPCRHVRGQRRTKTPRRDAFELFQVDFAA